MRELIKEYFFIPKEGKMHEKAFMGRLTFSIVLILICILGLGVTAYAHFTGSVNGGNNQVVSANYDLDITVNGAEIDLSLPLRLSAGNHSVVMTKKGQASTGFCVVQVAGGNTYNTAQIGKDALNGDCTELSFILSVKEDGTEVHFVPHWGTSTHYVEYKTAGDTNELYIIEGETVSIFAIRE
ncbi:MAG: hypothetical protein E7616_03800 [Ruminococcaceae bacterium]|nr:hypothetical protein [Oscillospiraceae bacterium]